MLITIEIDDGVEDAPIEEREFTTATVRFDGVIEAGYNQLVCNRLAETLRDITENYLDLAQMLGPYQEDEEDDEANGDTVEVQDAN